jgi:ornithine decarboxylase
MRRLKMYGNICVKKISQLKYSLQAALSINEGLRKYFPNSLSVEVVAEPGRYLVNSAFTLATTIYAKKVTSRNGEKYCMYSINDGFYGSFSQLLTKRIHVQPKIFGKAGKPCCKCTIWGPTCDSLDKVIV